VAFIDVPLVWFSIRWWSDTHHPPAMLETGGLSPAMRPAFFICMAAFLVLLVYLLRRRFFLQSMRDDLERLERQADTVKERML
jgi:heme exporter protein C